MFDECRDEGKLGKTAGETSASEPGRERSVEGEGSKLVESRKVGRGGLGVTGTGSHHWVQCCSPELCISRDRCGELMCCVAKRNKNPNTLPLRTQGACTKS